MVQIVSRLAALERRECGSCGMCCKLFHIAAVEKPAGKWRRHRTAGTGCSIHPDRSRIVLSIFPGNGFLDAQVDPSSPQEATPFDRMSPEENFVVEPALVPTVQPFARRERRPRAPDRRPALGVLPSRFAGLVKRGQA